MFSPQPYSASTFLMESQREKEAWNREREPGMAAARFTFFPTAHSHLGEYCNFFYGNSLRVDDERRIHVARLLLFMIMVYLSLTIVHSSPLFPFDMIYRKRETGNGYGRARCVDR